MLLEAVGQSADAKNNLMNFLKVRYSHVTGENPSVIGSEHVGEKPRIDEIIPCSPKIHPPMGFIYHEEK